MVVRQEQPRLQAIADEEDILAKDDYEKQKQKMDAGENTPVSQPSAVIVQPVAPSESVIRLQSSFIELDPAEDEYDIEHLEKYSRNTLERIIKWQHKHLQEGHNKNML
jgi:hypothetical protein